MQHQHRQAHLYLNGQPVGEVSADASSDGWGFGHFTPNQDFSRYALLFGSWSLLLHVDDDRGRTSPEAREELRAAELAIDRIKAELRWVDSGKRTPITQLIIDGSLVEWNLGSPSSLV